MLLTNTPDDLIGEQLGGVSSKLTGDVDYIVDLVRPRSTVLDLGCGTGDLLKELQERKSVFPQGVEISEECIRVCISRGLPVYHGNLDEGLADFEDLALDYIIVTNVIQMLQRPDKLLKEAARVARNVIVSFPNFAHYMARIQLGIKGHMPRTSRLPYQWYDSPNIHLTTIRDFEELCQQSGFEVTDRIYLARTEDNAFKRIYLWPNLFADQAIYVFHDPAPLQLASGI